MERDTLFCVVPLPFATLYLHLTSSKFGNVFIPGTPPKTIRLTFLISSLILTKYLIVDFANICRKAANLLESLDRILY